MNMKARHTESPSARRPTEDPAGARPWPAEDLVQSLGGLHPGRRARGRTAVPPKILEENSARLRPAEDLGGEVRN